MILKEQEDGCNFRILLINRSKLHKIKGFGIGGFSGKREISTKKAA